MALETHQIAIFKAAKRQNVCEGPFHNHITHIRYFPKNKLNHILLKIKYLLLTYWN